MQAVYCLDCARSINVSDVAQIGDPVFCPHCASEFEVIDLDPIDIEWANGADYDGLDGEGEGLLYRDDDDDTDDDMDDDMDDDWTHLIAKRQRVLQSTERTAPHRSDLTPAEAEAQLQAKRRQAQTQSGYAKLRQQRDTIDLD